MSKAIDLLRKVEWGCETEFSYYSDGSYVIPVYRCPICKRDRDDGHAPDCELDAMLKECE